MIAPERAPSPVSVLTALVFVLAAMWLGWRNIGLPPVIIVGGSSLVGLGLWLWSYRRGPPEPGVILPPFLLTVAALEAHMIEEYEAGFAPAMSRLFDISWTEHGFLLVFAFVGPIIYTLTALGLYWRKPFAGFVACFIFIGPGLAEFTHFIFPLIRPAIEPDNRAPVTALTRGVRLIADMPNHHLRTTGVYYFPGLYTAILPMIPGVVGIVRLLRAARP